MSTPRNNAPGSWPDKHMDDLFYHANYRRPTPPPLGPSFWFWLLAVGLGTFIGLWLVNGGFNQ
jgi:hypothetical protein